MMDLDYVGLMKRARTLAPNPDHTPVRLALLAECSTQHLSALLRVLAADRGIALDVYEAPFGALTLEAADPTSDLYRFAPQFTAILTQTEVLRAELTSTGTRPTVVQVCDRTVALWETLGECLSGHLIQSSYVTPGERAFGNYERLAEHSLGSRVADINAGVITAARARRNVLIHDVDYLAGEVGRRNWVDEKLWLMAKTPCALQFLPLYAKNLVDIIAAAIGRVTKCVVLDLDNTLWGGVIGDDGLDGIRLGDLAEGEAFVTLQRFLLSLKERGILLAVSSKNEHANAVLPFERHPDMVLKLDDIAVFKADWNDKAGNIRAIRETLNIGLDSLVFLDDNPFERNLVKGLLPEVTVPELPEDPAHYLRAIAALNLFEATTFSDTDLERAELYRVAARRSQAQASFDNVDDYLKSLAMKIRIERFNAFNLPRIAQLIQRSNQFNLCTRRYGEQACEQLMGDTDNVHPFTLTLEDRFGGHGLISVVVLRVAGADLEIDEYLMSCRVLKRGVESVAMNHIFDLARHRGCTRVIGRYLPTRKNDMVREFYRGFGFACIETGADGATVWSLAVDDYVAQAAHMSIESTPTLIEA